METFFNSALSTLTSRHFWLIVLSVCLCIAAFPFVLLSVFLCRSSISSRFRQSHTSRVLGLQGSNSHRKKEHGVANLAQYKSLQHWIKSLPRSAKCTLKRIDRVLNENQIEYHADAGPAHAVLGWEHWLVCIQHERRAYNHIILGLLAGSLRFLAGKSMEGSVDEYRRQDGKLVAWSSNIIKGRAMRAMWFYQSKTKCLIWFHQVRQNVERCVTMDLAHLDLGPSYNKEVKELKAKYGFLSTSDWNAGADAGESTDSAQRHSKEKADDDCTRRPSLRADFSGPFRSC